jgi:hypothetical protein
MSEQERESFQAEGRVSVTIELAAKGPRWRVRTTDLADEEIINRTISQSVAAYERLERELTGKASAPFRGQEPQAEYAGSA